MSYKKNFREKENEKKTNNFLGSFGDTYKQYFWKVEFFTSLCLTFIHQ